MIRVRVPLDLHAVAQSGSAAFALATPLRVATLVAMAVREAIGARAPADRFQRNLRTTLTGLRDGRYRVVIDGRVFQKSDAVVVCAGIADVRFFLNSQAERRSELTAPQH
ncbi:MAG: hypothetical protein M3Y21_01340 [Candidatus Eremiobacteraeota bacterium]|nr:hypothetical protein [Candidatus Eremiobacteraeota bacterium]